MENIVGIILAAGASNRFGGNKLLYPLRNGDPIALLSARPLCKIIQKVIAIIPPHQNELEQLFRNEGIEPIIFSDAKKGMGASLSYAVRNTINAEGWIICLADMPYIRHETIRTINNNLIDQTSIVYPTYKNRQGHPVGIGGHYFQELSMLDGASGAQKILAKHKNNTLAISCNDPGIIHDIDTPDDIISCHPTMNINKGYMMSE